MTPTVTLTSDFGLTDAYVAAMKGVMLSIAPGLSFVDVSHGVPPQDVLHGAYLLATAAPFFPEGTVHVAVVDPGVGTERRAIVARCGGSYLVGPDNGVLTLAADALLGAPQGAEWAEKDDAGDLTRTAEAAVPPGVEAYELANPAYRLAEVSDTFHGRDVFAPAAAHLALGIDPNHMGPRLTTMRWLRIARPVRRPDGSIEARVLHIDGYGNAITNVSRAHAVSVTSIEVKGRVIDEVSRSYDEAPADVLAVWGSGGRLEIAVKNGSAAQTLGLARGDRVMVRTGS